MITISKPKPEDAEKINEVVKKSWYDTYVNERVGITKEDIDLMYSESEEGQIEMFRDRAIHQRSDDLSLVSKDKESIVGFIRLKINKVVVELVWVVVYLEFCILRVVC